MPTSNSKVNFHFISTTAPASYDANTVYFDNINHTLKVGENVIANQSFRPVALEYSAGTTYDGATGTASISAAQIYQTYLNNSDQSRIVATVASNGGYNELPLVHAATNHAIFATLEYNKCENQYSLVENGPANLLNPQIIYMIIYDSGGTSYYFIREVDLSSSSEGPIEIKLSDPGYYSQYEGTGVNIPHTGPSWAELHTAGAATKEIHLIINNGGYNKERYTSYSLDDDAEMFCFFAPARSNMIGFYWISQNGTDYNVTYDPFPNATTSSY